jgi:hypothetical protein
MATVQRQSHPINMNMRKINELHEAEAIFAKQDNKITVLDNKTDFS